MIAATTRRQLWRCGAVAFFCGFPLVAIAAIVSNCLDATEAAKRAALHRATTASIVSKLERHRAPPITPHEAASLYLASTSDSLARAELQERATKLVAQSGGHLDQVQRRGEEA